MMTFPPQAAFVPMSLTQQGIYFDTHVCAPSDYHVALHLRIHPVKHLRIAQAVAQVMAEQPALRSGVRRTREGLSFAVMEHVDAPLEEHDLKGCGTDALEDVVRRACETAFVLDRAPLFRVVHIQLEEEDHLIVVCHHLIADGQSVSVLVERVLALALGASNDAERRMDNGYLAYQLKQAHLPANDKMARAEVFWSENLARQEAPDLAHWMKAASADSTGREIRIPLERPLHDVLRSAAQDAEVSEFALYLGAFGLLLSHYAQTEAVSVAVPFTDRPGVEMEDSVGCFIKTLPVRVDVRKQTVRELLEGVAGEIRESWRHLAYPQAGLFGQHPALGAVYDITFIQDSYPSLPAGVLSRVDSARVQFPGKFTVLVEQIGDHSEVVFQYKESALSTGQVRLFAHRYIDLLTRVPGALDSPVSALQPITPEEDDGLLASLSQTHRHDWQPSHLGTLFLQKTRSSPGRIAWSDADREYTNAWAHDAAVVVQRRVLACVGSEKQPVAVCLPRSADLLAAVFGTMLAGCPYVPLSPDTPRERLSRIVADAGIRVVLTTSESNLPFPADVIRLDIDDWEELALLHTDSRPQVHEEAALVDLCHDDVLYIEFTSGSTGVPKGVVVRHDNIHNTALALERLYPLQANDVYLLKTSFTFDIFGTEIYGWLMGEGLLAILPVGAEGDPLALLEAIREERVTHVNFSPTMLRALLDAASSGRAADLTGLVWLFSGGEALTADVVRQFFSLGLACSLENVYGPTEASMWATHDTVSVTDADAVAPLGLPLNDFRLYVVNPAGGLCGVDLPGEICIAGAGVAVGYLHHDDLNSTQFVENPFHDPATDPEHMRRMYRTGDFGYLRADGRFAFIRRIDRQVKVGGIRIELGEIEQSLLQADEVLSCAVIVDDTVPPSRLVGFFTAGRSLTIEPLRSTMAKKLTPQQVPSLLVQTAELPTTAAGKLDRRALIALLADRQVSTPVAVAAAGPLQKRIAKVWSLVLRQADIDVESSYFAQGGNSLNLMQLQLELQEEFGREVRITDLLRHHSVVAQTTLFQELVPDDLPTPVTARAGEDIAIIGIGIQVPGAHDVHGFWDNLLHCQESITFYTDDELRALGIPEADLRDPNYVPAHGRLDNVGFDGTLFEIAPAEAESTSPQLRLLYECFWKACEDAGYDPRALPGRVGAFVGGNDDFAWYAHSLMGQPSFSEAYQNFTLATNHFLATRLSYYFDLTGPSMAALAGCSTSLLTVHLAVQSLRAGECDIAVAGGVTLESPNDGGYHYAEGMMLSPDGHCRPFDADARGTVFSNGAALLVLKPVSAALRDGDHVYAVIKGSAVTNDGRRKLSYTAPSEDGQHEAIRAAYETCGIDPSTVTFVEAHGTGTLLGDPVEVASLTRAFAGSPAENCVLGSVKGNVGHTDSAAGAVGLSKVALSLKHRYLPATCNYKRPNPNVDFAATPFVVRGTGQHWGGDRLRAGVNSFGVGGTNVHMIMEQAPPNAGSTCRTHELLQFSAASPEALDKAALGVLRHLAENLDISLGDAAFTLRRGRAQLPYRKTIVVDTRDPRDNDAWVGQLGSAPVGQVLDGPRVAFLFSGQGNQHQGMGLGLYSSDSEHGAVFRQWMDRLIGFLPEDEAETFRGIVHGVEDDGRIHHTEWAQFALFSTQFATVKAFESLGVRPDVLVGHSIGELTAAALAGVWTPEVAALLVRERGRLMQAQLPGIMMAVAAPVERVRSVIAGLDDVWVSLDNSAQRCVLGMTKAAFGNLVDRLESEGIKGSRLHTSHAFHTPMMADAAAAFGAVVAGVASRDPSIPIISNRSGRVVQPGEMTRPDYWSRHITEEVRFADSLHGLLAGGAVLGVEIGPGASLSTFAAQDPGKGPEHVMVNVLRHASDPTPDDAHLLGALGTLWSAGLALADTSHDHGARVSLPGYVFDRSVSPQDPASLRNATSLTDVAPAAWPTVTPPQGDVLQGIRDAFRHVLGHRDVAPDADFFRLGGDSLKAAALSAHLKRVLGLHVGVADVFAMPTPAAIAENFRCGEVTAGLLKAPVADSYPLSPPQTRMYLAAKLDPAGLGYNMSSATRLRGRLDPQRVRLALSRLVERHVPLRTTFAVRDGELRQRVESAATACANLPLRFTTSNQAAEENCDELVARFVRPFNLAEGPLFRMEIVDQGEAGNLLLFDIHHIIADGTSVEVLSRDFSALYSGELAPLSLQYPDFAIHVTDERHRASLAEPTDQLVASLQDAPAADVLVVEPPRAGRTPTAGRVGLRLDGDRLARLRTVAQAHNATPFMVALSVWGAVLARYTTGDDLVIGVPVSGRTMSETQEMVGMFVNLLPIRVRPDATTPFGVYLADTRASVLDALSRQEVPFEDVVDRLGAGGGTGRHPLCSISFDYQNLTTHDLEIDGIVAEALEVAPLAVGMDLVITCYEGADALNIHLDHASDLVQRSTVEGLARYFEEVLERVCVDDAMLLGSIPLYSNADHDAIRARLGGAPFTPVHEMISLRAANSPDATAIIDVDGTRYSYVTLDGMANAQAIRLLDAGLRTGEHVAVFSKRDVNLLVAQLAILKAGGAYVLFDLAQPPARHESILADMTPRIAFADPGSRPGIATVFDIRTCTIESRATFDAPSVQADDPIYTVYTSGSTGAPKGITVTHRGVANLWHDHDDRHIFGPGDVIISLASPAFDIFTFESLLPLASGASVHMCPEDDAKDAAAISRRMHSHKVTHVQVPVSKMSALCGNALFCSQLTALKVITCGGEHFPQNLLELLQTESSARILNMYGPSETTVTTTVKEFAPGDSVTIGTPIRGSDVLVVNEAGMIQPDGVSGELCVAGQGVAIGYSNNPDETARKFTTIAELPEVRIYRTGDLGFRLGNGELVITGRRDHQVKLNGNRVELGEVEKTAMRVHGVTYAVAAVDGDDLVLYYSAAPGPDSEGMILSEIARTLPRYMSPQRIHRIDAMPMLPNGKVDRLSLRTVADALPAEDPGSAVAEGSRSVIWTEPTIVAEIMAAWEAVLGRAVAPEDNFFDVGGNSYKLMLVNNRLSVSLTTDIPLVKLFEHPTPQRLAQALGETLMANTVAAPVPSVRVSPAISLDEVEGFAPWPEESAATDQRHIAVIGVAGVFPGAATVAEHWDNRLRGQVDISRFSREELIAGGVDETTLDDPRYVNARGFVAADTFDADFFGYSTHEAETMDPQLRLLHETTWRAIEDAGYIPGSYPGDIALFAGSGTNFGWMASFLNRVDDPTGAFEAMTANEKDFLATKVAYKLGLTGPAVTVQTACSTSLVAIHEAVQCLRQGGADMALAGGVALNFPRKEGYSWREGMIFSADGVCRPFSSDANGTVAGQGCGVVLLKPLDRARADGDHIYAVVSGSAINNDGRAKVGYTAPSVQGQQQVIRAALADACIHPDEIGYVETHGTGTELGDPIEYAALSAVYGGGEPCALGAVKANIGHLDAAAGVAGFLGAVGVLHRDEVPPMANYASLNPNIVASKGLQVSTVEAPFARRVDVVAVSSFGIGGTNAHLVLQRAPQDDRDPDPELTEEVVLPVSARTDGSRQRAQTELESFMHARPGLRDASFTLAISRAVFASRAVAFALPGCPLTWHAASDPRLALDVSDDAVLQLAEDPTGDQSAVSKDVAAALDRALALFDDRLAATISSAAYGRGVKGRGASSLAVRRLAQFVVRAALVQTVGARSLHTRHGAGRMLGIARAFVAEEIDAREVVALLSTGGAPVQESVEPTPAPELVTGPLDPTLLRRLLSSCWTHGEDIDRLRFCAPGRRIPMPGYAFERRSLKSDISWADLRGMPRHPTAARAVPDSGDALTYNPAKILAQAWHEVLGDEPSEDTDFLGSGGDSLSAVRLCSLVEDRLGTKLTVGDVFAAPLFGVLRGVLESRINADSSAGPDLTVSPAEDARRSEFPTSPAQQRMYAVCGLQEGTTAYNLASAHRVTGPLDLNRLRAAFQRLVARHDQLRTSFHLKAGELVQRVHGEVPDIVSVADVTAREAEARLAEGPKPFDLAGAPLIRVEVLRVDTELHYLVVDMHHIIGDQTSLAVLTDDLTAELQGVALPDAGLSYIDYVRTLEAREADGGFADDIDFFAELLAADIPRLALPVDRMPPEAPTFEGRRHTFTTAVGRRSVTDLARQCGATPYMVFLAALGRVFGLYGGQTEYLLGTAVSGRTVPGTERTVGMFANTLPLRVTDSPRQSVREAIAAARNTVLPVLAHQQAPFEAVLARLGLRPGGDTHPLFDVLFNFVNMGTEDFALDGVRLESLPAEHVTSRYDLSLSVAEGAEGFSVDIEYRTELFDPSTITRIATHLDRLLSAMTADPDAVMARLDLETPLERTARRAALTAPGTTISSSLLAEVRSSLAQHGSLPALLWGDDEWSYAEVDRITDALAGGLQAVGVSQGEFVLCLLDRGPWQVFTRLALLKCGAVEIPLAVDVPDARIRETLGDSDARIVLSSLPTHPWPCGVQAYRPEELSGHYAAPGGVTAESPLIMIYTSGTTGQPKGTLVTHGGVLSTCRDNGYMDYRPGDRVLHLTGYTFDPSLLDIYSTFLAGATLCMGGQEVNMDTRLLAAFLADRGIDKGILITAVFHLLMAEDPQAVAGMSSLYIGGEAMQTWAAQKAYDVLGSGKLYNLYGPTEASICTTWFRVDEYPDHKRMPIGFPARNRELFIVHPDGTDVPRGVPGELCVAGPSLAIGYHQRPELTLERFTDSLGDLPVRVYRTGDRVVLDESDRIVFIDRVDRQIKHAGHRIELSGIELAIGSCVGVTEAVVLHTNERTVSRLEGFYTGDAAPSPAELRQLLLGRLPDYMVPQLLVHVPVFPLTAHGKIDHTRLATAGTESVAPEGNVVAPRSLPGLADPVILAAFREALGTNDLAASDDLFRAGAQSIQAIAVARRLREAGMNLQVSDVYRYPTAETLSAALNRGPDPGTREVTTRLRRPLEGVQLQRLVTWSVEDASRVSESFTDDEPSYSFATGVATKFHVASGADRAGFLQSVTGSALEDVTRALTALVVQHEVLRARLAGDHMEVLDPTAFTDLHALVAVRDLRGVETEQVREFVDDLARALQCAPFTAGLLWRCVIVRLSDTESRLVWAFHHGIFDGFSAGVLGDELERLARGEDVRQAGRYSDFLTGLDTEVDWTSELASFDYDGWLAANRALLLAVPRGGDAENAERMTLPLGGSDPLGLALVSAWRILSGITGADDIAVGLVTDCRRWGPDDYTDCLGEFLDVVPVLLRGDDDQSAVAARVARAQAQRLHYMHLLSTWRGNDDTLGRLQAVYWGNSSKLDLALLNFQGYIALDDVPSGSMPGPAPARLQLNVWYDERSLHLQLIGGAVGSVVAGVSS